VSDAPVLPWSRPRLLVERVVVRDFRNLTKVDFAPASRLNVIVGDNGHGKTSLLEAIYFAATSRSFRTSKLAELVRHEARQCVVRGRFAECDEGSTVLVREQTATVERGRCQVRIDGNRPPTLAEFATRSPVVIFHPNELALSSGPGAGRRTLLDRLALFLDPLSADHRGRYAHAVRSRQKLLRAGITSSERADLEAFEELCAYHGAALTAARLRAALDLVPALERAFAQIGATDLVLEARFVPGGSTDVGEARVELRRQRERDLRRPSPGFGPHRDDLVLSLNGHPARLVASQGQHRALTLALKAAETECIAQVRGLEPILLLDDVSSELDAARTQALFSFLGRSGSQVFLTTTRRELIVASSISPSHRHDVELSQGVLRPLV
jgi:DNA replication and repair protein RecF